MTSPRSSARADGGYAMAAIALLLALASILMIETTTGMNNFDRTFTLMVPALLLVGAFVSLYRSWYPSALIMAGFGMGFVISTALIDSIKDGLDVGLFALPYTILCLALIMIATRRRQLYELLCAALVIASSGLIIGLDFYAATKIDSISIILAFTLLFCGFILLNRINVKRKSYAVTVSQIRRSNIVMLVMFILLQLYIFAVWSTLVTSDTDTLPTLSPPGIVLFGQLLCALVGISILLQFFTARRTVAYTDKITDELEIERNNAEAVARQDEIIFGGIGEGLIIYDKQLRISRYNPIAASMLSLSDTSIGRPLAIDGTPRDGDDNQLQAKDMPAARALATRATVEQLVSYVRDDGSNLDLSIIASPMVLSGKVIGAIELFRDVTEERNLDRAKTEFVSLASHQLRTPLAAISWYSEMLTDADADTLNEQQMLYVKEIIRGNARMVELIESFLNVSRLEANRLLNYAAPTDVGATIQQVVAGMDDDIVQRNLAFTMSIAHNLPQMMVDPKLLTIVLGHVISNAIKYSPDSGRVNVAVKVGNNTDAAHPIAKPPYITITVSDTGYGIPNHQQQLVFSKMFRAQNIQTKDISGTGLGLYIIREIATLLGGAISFHSIENQGTTFQVVLPITTMNQTERNQQS